MTAPALDARTGPPPRPARLPGDIDMWVMVLGDFFFFGCYFATYMVFRAGSPEEFRAAQAHLHIGLGVANTVVLLTGSLFAALAVFAVREGRLRSGQRLLGATGACGAVFVMVKAYEWYSAASAGHTLTDDFFDFYYGLTGVHLVHVALGLLILGVAVRELRATHPRRPSIVEQGVLFWHMVDLLWVVIFAMLYLMR